MSTKPSDGLVALYPHITKRDRKLFSLLDQHHVLTTSQIARLFFRQPTTCRARLLELCQLELLQRFRFNRPEGGTYPYGWVLGYTGQRFQAAANGERQPTRRASAERVDKLTTSPTREHLLTVNEFFVRLSAHARHNPDTSLARWWSENETAKRFQHIRPDGHGLWTVRVQTVGFWLEADTGTEPLTRVTAKLSKYRALIAAGGPRYPVLFWLPNQTREENLQRLLRQQATDIPTGTATHDSSPAQAVWLPGGGYDRLPLHELPSDHGRPIAGNANYRDGELDF